MKTYYEKLPAWHQPLAFHHEESLNDFLDELMGKNNSITQKERLEFVELLYKSLSLSESEKIRVLDAFRKLSDNQFKDLKEVFRSETDKFIELEKEHKKDIITLVNRQLLDWFLILDPKNGDKSFTELYIKRKISSKNSLDIAYRVIMRLNSLEKYSSILLLSRKALNDYKDHSSEEIFRYLNAYCFSYIIKYSHPKELEKSFAHISSKIKESNLPKNIENKLNFYNHVYYQFHKGASHITIKDYEKLLHLYRGGKNISYIQRYHLAIFNLFSFRDVNKSLNTISKSFNRKKVSADELSKFIINDIHDENEDSINMLTFLLNIQLTSNDAYMHLFSSKVCFLISENIALENPTVFKLPKNSLFSVVYIYLISGKSDQLYSSEIIQKISNTKDYRSQALLSLNNKEINYKNIKKYINLYSKNCTSKIDWDMFFFYLTPFIRKTKKDKAILRSFLFSLYKKYGKKELLLDKAHIKKTKPIITGKVEAEIDERILLRFVNDDDEQNSE